MKNIKTIIGDMLIISTTMILGLGVMEMIMHFTRGITTFEMPWFIPLTIPLTAFLCAMPSALVSDCDKLNRRQIIIRVCIHFACLLAVVTICGYLFGWFSNALEYIVIALEFTIIYISVWAISWWLSKRDEIVINGVLRDFQDEE